MFERIKRAVLRSNPRSAGRPDHVQGIPFTRAKLEEAQFLLSKIEACRRSVDESNRAASYYLSAFLAAARSVTQVLESEAPDLYRRWSDEWRHALPKEDQKLLALFVDTRNRGLKRQIVDVKVKTPSARDFAPELLFFFEGDPPLDPSDLLARLGKERIESDLLPRARRYYGLLVAGIEEFESKYVRPSR
jgi:hypothetical protein